MYETQKGLYVEIEDLSHVDDIFCPEALVHHEYVSESEVEYHHFYR